MKAALLLCSTCKWWTGYRATKGGQKRIDTICRVCGARLRYTHRPQGWAWGFKTVAPHYAKGSGNHNKSQSVSVAIETEPKRVMKEASERNKLIQRRIALRDGVDLDEEE
jgi:hypothetical protein